MQFWEGERCSGDFFLQRLRNSGGLQFLENILSPQSNLDSKHMKQWGIACLGWATLKGFFPFCLLCNFAEEVLLLLEFGSVKSSQRLEIKPQIRDFYPWILQGWGWMSASVGCVCWKLKDPTCDYFLKSCFLPGIPNFTEPLNTEREQLWGFMQCFPSWEKNSQVWGEFRSEVPALDSKYLSWCLTCLGDSTWIFLSSYFPWRVWNNDDCTWDTELGCDYSGLFLPCSEVWFVVP